MQFESDMLAFIQGMHHAMLELLTMLLSSSDSMRWSPHTTRTRQPLAGDGLGHTAGMKGEL